MNDYYSFANFFSRIGRKRAEDPRESIIYDRTSGETNHILTKKKSKRKRQLGLTQQVADSDVKSVKRMLPYS